MKKIIAIILIPICAFSWDFTQERNTIPVNFNDVPTQSPWGTGYNYIAPVLADIDNDGDKDLVVGSDWNRLTLLLNQGTTNNYYFVFIYDTLVNVPTNQPQSQTPNRPEFADIDNDGDLDLFVGTYYPYPINEGKLLFYENMGDSSNYNYILFEENFQGINCVWSETQPRFIDIDDDGDLDLFLGFQTPGIGLAGRIQFFINQGTPDSASMILESAQFLGIDLGYYCIPAFTDIDADSDYDMFLGDEDGNIHFYRNEGTPEVYDFVLISDNYFNIDVGLIASPTFCDIDDDGDYDLFVGERSWGEDNNHGDIWFFENIGTPGTADFQLVTQNFVGIDVGAGCTPTFADIDNDGLMDIFLGEGDGNINYFTNVGTETGPEFSLAENAFQNIWATYQSRPTFGDLDNDGDLDLLVGRVYYNTGSIYYYENTGSPESARFDLISNTFLGIDFQIPVPRLVDIDNDGDLDLFVGHAWNQVVYWKNEGTVDTANFVLEDDNFLNTPYEGDYCFICFGDIDNDNDYDLIRGHYDHTLDLYRNIGTAESPNLVLEEEGFLGIQIVLNPEPALSDIDNDGDMDLFVGSFCGGVSFWRNNEVNSVDNRNFNKPYAFTLLQNYPNPFNNSTIIPFTLDRKMLVKVKVYNQQGQVVTTLIDGALDPGSHQISWDAGGFSSGVYLVNISAVDQSENIKTILVK